MRYFLIFLLWSISFLSTAQDVVIPTNVARYFLEQDDRVKILIQKDSISRQLIVDLNEELLVKQKEIVTYRDDSITMHEIITTKDQDIFSARKDLIIAKKSLDNKIAESIFYKGTTAGAIIGSFIPGLGTVPGAVIGGATGCVIHLVFRFKKLFKR